MEASSFTHSQSHPESSGIIRSHAESYGVVWSCTESSKVFGSRSESTGAFRCVVFVTRDFISFVSNVDSGQLWTTSDKFERLLTTPVDSNSDRLQFQANLGDSGQLRTISDDSDSRKIWAIPDGSRRFQKIPDNDG